MYEKRGHFDEKGTHGAQVEAVMRLFISSDIEGVAGIVTREQTNPQGFEYQAARRWMTGELISIIRGAERAGFKEITVADSHGNGQNLLFEEMPQIVTLIRSWPRPLGMMEGIQIGEYDGAILHGFHAGVDAVSGTLAHTLSTSGISGLRLNGIQASEALLCAGVAGHFGVPVVMVSGDDAFAREMKLLLPNVLAVVSKQSLGWHSAAQLSHGTVCAELENVAARIVSRSPGPYVFRGPVVAEVSCVDRLAAEVLGLLGPPIERVGSHSIQFTGPTILEVMRFLSFLLFFRLTR